MSTRIICIAVSLSVLAITTGCGQEPEPVQQSTAAATVDREPMSEPSVLPITPAKTIGSIVAETPQAARLFELLDIDYCCGGQATLAHVAKERSLDVQRLIGVLGLLGESPARKAGRSWAQAPLNDLIHHIVDKHHAYLRRALPRLGEIVATVLRVHGDAHPELVEVSKLYTEMRAAIPPHLDMEEQTVFPAILSLSAATASRTKQLLKELRDDHDDVGQSLHRIRELTNNYTPPTGACALYTQMLTGLHELERDLHVHVHLENSVLIPRAEQAVNDV